jgi:phosphohistidine phosphatase
LELFILRHGEAGKSLPTSPKEFQRPLTEVGHERIEEVGQSLKKWNVNFDKVLTSPLRRAKETAETVAKVLDIESRLEDSDNLKPEGNRTELYRTLSKMKRQDTVLIVGHEPYLSILIGDIIAGNPNSHISLKKGGLAKIDIETFSPKISGELRWLLTPRQIRKIK